eukprot:3954928-Pleurochrysis_carterae.AAC.2
MTQGDTGNERGIGVSDLTWSSNASVDPGLKRVRLELGGLDGRNVKKAESAWARTRLIGEKACLGGEAGRDCFADPARSKESVFRRRSGAGNAQRVTAGVLRLIDCIKRERRLT